MLTPKKRPNTPTIFLKQRPPHSIDIFDLRTRKRLRTITVPDEITDSGAGFWRKNRRVAEIVWVILKDNRAFTFSPKNGRLLNVQPDPCKDPVTQKALSAMLAKNVSPIRFAVVLAISRGCTMYYDFANGTWDNNRISATAMFKEREVAEAAATALTKLRKTSFYGRSSRPMQVVEFQKTANGGKILSAVNSASGPYRPILFRFCGRKIRPGHEWT